ncbi:hypothetical protein HYV49_00990 [Candidatus Pacearchaeota archaeon]|nr:hypothetical protein [Candidatus Pacearchaeota archaeon]
MRVILQSIPLDLADFAALDGLVGFILAFFVFFIILGIAIYIYTSFAYMSIARKTKTEPAGIAWIPLIGPSLIASKIAKMHWWPILLLIGFWIPFLNFVLFITFTVFYFIWMWKTFEAVGKPGWWILFSLIPFAGQIIFLVLLGVAAWSNSQQMQASSSRPVRRKSK